MATLDDRTDPLMVDYLSFAMSYHAAGWFSPAPAIERFTPRLGKVVQYVNDNLGHRMTLTELSGVACLSPHHFLRSFKRHTGTTPHAYVMRRRVERAQGMLSRSMKMSLASIALSCGFASQAHFTKCFKQHAGRTPGEYRLMLVGREQDNELPSAAQRQA